MRIVARIDIKNSYAIKGIHLEGLRKVGDPNEMALSYYRNGIDEILFMDAVASLYGRNSLYETITKACDDIFVPITVGGGIGSLEDVSMALSCGADKVAINSALVRHPELAAEVSLKYGSQCMVASIEAKRKRGQWEVYIDNGREKTGKDVIDWAIHLQNSGVGEILITSIDAEGTKRGFDIDLVHSLNKVLKIPVVASGGAGTFRHIEELYSITQPSGVALASVLHYGLLSPREIKKNISSTYYVGS